MRLSEFTSSNKKIIGEVGDTAYDVTPVPLSDPSKNYKIMKRGAENPSNIFSFVTGSGIKYIMYIYKMKTNGGIDGISISFGTTYRKDPDKKDPHGSTGTGDSIKVFATVKNVLLKYLSNHPNVQFVTFTAKRDDSKRVKLYNYIAGQFQKWFRGFSEVRTRYFDDYVQFIVSRQSIDPRKISLANK